MNVSRIASSYWLGNLSQLLQISIGINQLLSSLDTFLALRTLLAHNNWSFLRSKPSLLHPYCVTLWCAALPLLVPKRPYVFLLHTVHAPKPM